MKTISKQGLVTILCILMIMFTSIGLAKAYFSDYTQTSGQAKLTLSSEVFMDENVDDDGTKHVTVTNNGTSDLVVRVVVYGPWLSDEDMAKDISGDGWKVKGNCCYYTKVLASGETTSKLEIAIANIDDANGRIDNFDVTVRFQAAIATYADGKVAIPDDWDYIPEISK